MVEQSMCHFMGKHHGQLVVILHNVQKASVDEYVSCLQQDIMAAFMS